MSEKRFRMETIGDVLPPFIVDNSTGWKNGKFMSYHTYETHSEEKCLELVDVLNNYEDIIKKRNQHQRVLESKISRMREAIHKLEWLASHRNADLIRENSNLKNRISILEAFLKQNDLLYEIDWIEFCTVAKCNQLDGTDCETCFYLGEYFE